MAEITCSLVVRVGVDLSKRVYQVHAVDRGGRVLLAKALSPDRFFAWCAELPSGCLVAMEACEAPTTRRAGFGCWAWTPG